MINDNLNIKIPKHIAIILDGNGTWAKNRGLERMQGHKYGAKALVKIVEYAVNIKLENLTVFAFSTENWKRSKEEVSYLMKLLSIMIRANKKKLKESNIRLRIIGTYDKLNEEQIVMIEDVVEYTKDCTGLNFTVAFNYGAHEEIIHAIKEIAEDKVKTEDITPQLFNSYLYTKDLPAVDLMIRTSKQIRISNFLLWQIAYSELYFVNTLWPDFTSEDLDKAIIEYNNRDRRFGGIKK